MSSHRMSNPSSIRTAIASAWFLAACGESTTPPTAAPDEPAAPTEAAAKSDHEHGAHHEHAPSNAASAPSSAPVVGTLDGANVEIRECVGDDNFFLFGIEEPEVEPARAERAAGKFEPDPRFTAVMDTIKSGVFGKPGEFDELLWSLEGNEGFGRGDYFLVAKDFPSYIECQDKVSAAYKDQDAWTESSIISTAFSGKFNSDRTIDQYAKEIWGIEPCSVPEK